MSREISSSEASEALTAVSRSRREVAAEIGVPSWYWPLLTAAWVGLGAISQFGPAWLASTATLAFGAVHAFVSRRALSGRHGSTRVSVRGDLVSRRVPFVVIGFLLSMVVVTIAVALALDADGTEHPAFAAGCVVGALVLVGGPTLIGLVRRQGMRLPA